MKKFILVEVRRDNLLSYHYLIFNKDLVHSVMFLAMNTVIDIQFKRNINSDYNKCVSAGFINQYDNFCGESESLNIQCHPETEQIIRTISFHNIHPLELALTPIPIKKPQQE